jgi:hypothetical protein
MSAIHYTTTIDNYDVAEIDLQVIDDLPASVLTGMTKAHMVLNVDMLLNNYAHDADMVNTYLNDGQPAFNTGSVLPHIVTPPSPNSKLIMNFHQWSSINRWAPLRFYLINHEGFWKTDPFASPPGPMTYRLKIPMLKNPSVLNSSYYTIVRAVEWRVDTDKNFQIPTILA